MVAARRIWSTAAARVEFAADRSTVGMVESDAARVLRSDRVSGGWTKKGGRVWMPESTRPLTPSLELSNCLSASARS